jgi:hippurate hydrolase
MTHRSQLIQSISSEATEWRRELHRNPQTMYEEHYASNLVAAKLTKWGIAHERGIAGTGIAATIEGRRNLSGRAVAFRADMDALDIAEQSGQPWASQTPGKMHGCGHDGHTATLLTLARYLNETRNFDGAVRLIFQPAEEGGRGANRMLEEGLLDRFPFDEIYGYHNWPGLPRGEFAISPGAMLAATDFFEIRLTGKGGHAAMPHTTVDVIPAISHLVMALQTLVSREADPMAAAVLSVTNLSAGSGANNVISGTALLNGTVRTFRQDLRDRLEERMRKLTESVAAGFNAAFTFDYRRITDPVVNHPESTAYCRLAAAALAGDDHVKTFDPMMGGEDFGSFLQVRPGAFIASDKPSPIPPVHTILACTLRFTISTTPSSPSRPPISRNWRKCVCLSIKIAALNRDSHFDFVSGLRRCTW